MGRSEGAAGFEQWLERGLGSASATGGSSIAERMEQRVEAQVMRSIRAPGGRASGADPRDGRTASRAAETRPERGAAEAQRAERAADERPLERSRERSLERGRDEHDEYAFDGTSRDASHAAPRARSLEGHARALRAANAAEASGAEATSPDAPSPTGTSFGGASSAAALPPHANQVLTAAVSAAGAQGAPSASGAPAVGSAASNASASALHGLAADGPRAAADSKSAASAAPVPHSSPAEDLELAEKVMRQLRARLQIGQREALIELRPSELGRIGVHLRFEDGALTATIRAERPETLAVLEAHAPELRAWLAQDGAEVREIDLGLAERGTYFDKHQQRPQDGPNGRRGGASGREARQRASVGIQASARTNTRDATPGASMPNVDIPSVDVLV